MRLIDVDAATFPTPHRKEANDYMRGWNLCLRSVLQQPAVDAMPVRHGTWLPIVEANQDGSPYQTGVFCSECRHCDCVETNYCPNCGAKMDGGTE